MRFVGIVAGLLVMGCVALAADDEVPARRDAAPAPVEDDVSLLPDVDPLGRTVRLLFRLEPEERGRDRLLYVLSAGTRYRVSADYLTAEGAYGIEVTGTLKTLDNGAVLTGFHAFLRRSAKGSDMQFAASGSVILKPGKPAIVASLGEKALEVTLEDAAAAQ